MFTKTSMTGTGMLVLLIEYGLHYFGIEISQGSIIEFVNGIIVILGFTLSMIGQLRREDLSFGLFRK